MDRKAWVQVFLALGVGVPGLAQAMGLGELIVLSGPGEPFRAEIPIRSEHPRELTSAQAGLAPASAFSLIHLPVDPTLSQWHFSVREGSQPAILISSPLPLTQASLPFLVQLDWSGGQIVREYRASSAAATTYGVPATRLATPSPSPRPSAEAMPYPPMPARSPRTEVAGWASASRYGPVPEHQTLFDIARKLSRSNRVSLDQVMAALVKANPGAFKNGNPNLLYAGTYLETPSLAQVQAMTPAQARAWLRGQRLGVSAKSTPVAANQAVPANATTNAGAPATRLVLSSAPSSVAAAASSAAAVPASTAAAVSTSSTAATQSSVAALQSDNAHLQTMLQALNTRLTQTQAQMASQAAELARLSQASAQAHPGSNPLLWLSLGGNLLLLLLFLWVYQRQQEAARRQREVSQKVTMLAGNGNGTGARPTPPPPSEAPAAFAPPPRPEPFLTPGTVAPASAPQASTPKAAVAEPQAAVEPTVAAAAATGGLDFSHATADSAPAAGEAADSARTAAVAGAESTGTFGVDASDPLQVDPLEQADLYLTYGKSDSAVTVLQEALEENPRRKELYVKLLDLYAQLDRRDAYLELAERMRGRFGPVNGAWQQVASQGAQLFPGHSLFADAAAVASTPPQSAAAPATTVQSAPDSHHAFDVSALSASASQDTPQAEHDTGATGTDHLLDFNLDSLLGSADAEEDSAVPQHEIPAAEKQRLLDSVDEQFRALEAESRTESPTGSGSTLLESDFAHHPDSAGDEPHPSAPSQDAGAETAGDWDAVGTKLDLAKAYLEMDDADSARELLEEVSREGNPQQRSEAHSLLESL
ncbi:FimV/HubP family polar landmark protein [Acidithiobacillus caldus]